MVGWHHRLNGYGFEWTPGVGDGQGGLVCCGSWGCKESDTTEWMNCTDAILVFTISDFISITSLTHNWVSFFLWLHLFILTEVISSLISSSILGTYRLGESIFQCPFFLPFHTVHGVLKARILRWFAILQWTTFCQNFPPWPILLGWPCMAWVIVSLS